MIALRNDFSNLNWKMDSEERFIAASLVSIEPSLAKMTRPSHYSQS